MNSSANPGENLYPDISHFDGLSAESFLETLPRKACKIKNDLEALCNEYNCNQNDELHFQFEKLRAKKLRINHGKLAFSPNLFGITAFQAKNEDDAYDALPPFINFLNSYAEIIDAYEQLKKLAIQAGVFSREEADAIEQAARKQGQEFFPMIQELFDTQVATVKADTQATVANANAKIKEINAAYEERSGIFLSCHVVLGLGSLVISIFPLFLASVALHVLDSFITLGRVAAQGYKARQVLADEPKKIEALKTQKHADLKNTTDQTVLFKQRFFEIPLNDPAVKEIDAAIKSHSPSLVLVR